jgi:hypothetical protein
VVIGEAEAIRNVSARIDELRPCSLLIEQHDAAVPWKHTPAGIAVIDRQRDCPVCVCRSYARVARLAAGK